MSRLVDGKVEPLEIITGMSEPEFRRRYTPGTLVRIGSVAAEVFRVRARGGGRWTVWIRRRASG